LGNMIQGLVKHNLHVPYLPFFGFFIKRMMANAELETAKNPFCGRKGLKRTASGFAVG